MPSRLLILNLLVVLVFCSIAIDCVQYVHIEGKAIIDNNWHILIFVISLFVFIFLFTHLSKVAQFIITIRIDCVRELKKGAPKVFKKC